MSTSKLSNFGTFFPRITGLLEASATKAPPTWYNVNKKHPPDPGTDNGPSLLHRGITIEAASRGDSIDEHNPIKVAVVGSGPAGFYTTKSLLKNPKINVDIYEKLPVPFGLVRYGVAPDHADVKNVINSFTATANSDRVNFYGNVGLGESVDLDKLAEAYHAVVLSYGSAQDKMLNIEGETTTKNTISARRFVGWYNGLPADQDLELNLNCDTACIIGQGNVALDCARILLKPAHLDKTDITLQAQQMLSKSRIKKIYVIGRRGPVQVSFTIKELRELINLNKSGIRLEPEFPVLEERSAELSRQRRRLIELLVNAPKQFDEKVGGIQCIFRFLSRPSKIIAKNGNVAQLEIERMRFRSDIDLLSENAKPDSQSEFERIDCGLIIKSIGYKAVVVDKNLPVDDKLGAIMNTKGRVTGHKGIYCSGWLATGASGVIAGALESSRVTAQSILEDITQDAIPNLNVRKAGYEQISEVLLSKGVQVVHFNDWLRIDELERKLGRTLGKSREKIVDINEILRSATDGRNQ